MKIKVLIVVLILSISNYAFGQTKKAKLSEQQKIEALIASIEKLDNAKFYRNGSYYDSKSAGKHLRMKLEKAGGKIKTARDFIDKIATKSSMSGEYYKIVFNDGKVIHASTFLYNVLKSLE